MIPWITSWASAEGFVWWEGEHPFTTNVPEGSPFRPGTGGDFAVLSGGDWISGVVKAGGAPYEATYRLSVPADGTYELWARKFWKHGPVQWRFNDLPWRTLGRDVALADSAPIRQHLVANWVALGSVELPAGVATFTWRMTGLQPGKDEGVAFDCFVLASEPFTPRGRLKPGQSDARAEPGWFAWDPPTDPFPDDAGFDHRTLNEARAGMHGRVRASADGNALQLGDGTPVRFWGVNVNPDMGAHPDALLRYHARKLAKLGVNLVRIHGPLWDPSPDAPRPRRVDPDRLDRVHRLVAAYQREGIYVNLSWYFPVWIDAQQAGLPGYEHTPGGHPFAAVFFDDAAQRWYFDTLRTVMATPNPHTGRPLADDPAVAFVELVNEDSFFFWTFNDRNLPPELWSRLQQKFEASPHFQGGKLEGVWRMTTEGFEQTTGRHRRQVQAQAAFLADTQRGFYAEGKAFLQRLGYDGLVIAGNWHTADPARLDALERWTYTAADVIDHHGYFEAKHEGEGSGYSVRVGHTYADREALKNLGTLPVRVNQVAGKPQMISEINWPLPNRYRADMVWITVAALGVQGVDAVCWFAVTTPTLNDAGSSKFTIDVPSIAGQFPAAALAFRRGDVPEQKPVVVDALRSDALKQLAGSATANHASLDPLRAGNVPESKARPRTRERFASVDPLAYYLGPVVRAFDRDDQPPHSGELFPRIRRGEGLTMPGQGEWVSANEAGVTLDRLVLTIERSALAARYDTLPASAPAPFGPVGLTPDVGQRMFSAIALDGLPWKESRRVLLTRIGYEQPYGYTAQGGRIVRLGGAPLNLPRVEGWQLFWTSEGGGVYHATALDENGNRLEAAIEPLGDAAEIDGFRWPEDAVYVLLEHGSEAVPAHTEPPAEDANGR